MSGIIIRAVTVRAELRCDKCGETWTSGDYTRARYTAAVEPCAPAFADGWRVYAGKRAQRTYCPQHYPTTVMRQVHP